MSSLEDKKTLIINGISAGMDLDDMLILAHCSPREMEEIKGDDFFLSTCKSSTKSLELDLLKNLHNIITVQTEKGKDHGTIWLLGKLNPRFSDRPENGDKPGVINIYTQDLSLDKMPTVEIYEGGKH